MTKVKTLPNDVTPEEVKKVSGTITIDFSAWVKDDYDTEELIEYLKRYYSGAVPDGWPHRS